MATYKEIQMEFRKRYGKTIKTCWIAEVKANQGLTRGPAPNRIGKERTNPCPKEYWDKIENIIRDLGMN